MTVGVCGLSHSFRTPGVLVAGSRRGLPRGERGACSRSGIVCDRDGRVASRQPAARRVDGARLGEGDCGARASVTRDVDRLGARPQVGRSAVARAVASLRALAHRRPQARVIRTRRPVGRRLRGAAALARRLGASARSTTWISLPVLVTYLPGRIRDASPVVCLPAVRRRLLAARDRREEAVATRLRGAAAACPLGEPARLGAARRGARLARRPRRVGASYSRLVPDVDSGTPWR